MRDRTLTVSQLNRYIKGVFEDEIVLHDLNVEGEVYEFKQTPATVFVTLKESDSLLHCVSFDCFQKLDVGDKVSLFGSAAFYERNGKMSFVYRSARAFGKGRLNAEYNALKNKLENEGLFSNKKDIKSPVTDIALITSETGAVIHDFIKTIHRKRKFTNITVYPSEVQGKRAEADLTANLHAADGNGHDVIVIARGGGGSDDLDIFNNENMVRAVAACKTPVISAVGHETDFTLCDFAASLRAGTPSMAGEIISRKNEEFFEKFFDAVYRLDSNVNRVFAYKLNGLKNSSADVSYKSIANFERFATSVKVLSYRLSNKLDKCLERKNSPAVNAGKNLAYNIERIYDKYKNKIAGAASALSANDPLRILAKGYAKIYNESGKAAAYEKLATGDAVTAVMDGGRIKAKVVEKIANGNQKL